MTGDFFTYQAQTTPQPLAMKVSFAKGSYIYDDKGIPHLDFVAGVSACSLGHCHPSVISAVERQLKQYMHVMVYGEYIQEPAVAFTKLLAQHIPAPLEKTYLVNSGTEAIEGALKLARRATGRSQIIAMHHAYHGNTMGSLSIMGYERRKSVFRPLLPDVRFIRFNSIPDLELISNRTAAVIIETIQGGAGFIIPGTEYMAALRQKCSEAGALLIVDEIQPGFGRTGTLFGFQHYDIIPDIICMGKGMGGGLPVGAFTASATLMNLLQHTPELGHITTFGGNPVIAAASLAVLETLTSTTLMADTLLKETYLRQRLRHPLIQEIRGKGLMLALILPSEEIANQLVLRCKEARLILFWLLFEKRAVRITPPLITTETELEEGCSIILRILDSIYTEI